MTKCPNQTSLLSHTSSTAHIITHVYMHVSADKLVANIIDSPCYAFTTHKRNCMWYGVDTCSQPRPIYSSNDVHRHPTHFGHAYACTSVQVSPLTAVHARGYTVHRPDRQSLTATKYIYLWDTHLLLQQFMSTDSELEVVAGFNDVQRTHSPIDAMYIQLALHGSHVLVQYC